MKYQGIKIIVSMLYSNARLCGLLVGSFFGRQEEKFAKELNLENLNRFGFASSSKQTNNKQLRRTQRRSFNLVSARGHKHWFHFTTGVSVFCPFICLCVDETFLIFKVFVEKDPVHLCTIDQQHVYSIVHVLRRILYIHPTVILSRD